jgi:cytochrome c
MRSFVSLFVLMSLSGTTGLVYADNDLLIKKNCLACHSIDKRKYGPELNEVAANYADDKNAEKELAKKIKASGSDVLGCRRDATSAASL